MYQDNAVGPTSIKGSFFLVFICVLLYDFHYKCTYMHLGGDVYMSVASKQFCDHVDVTFLRRQMQRRQTVLHTQIHAA